MRQSATPSPRDAPGNDSASTVALNHTGAAASSASPPSPLERAALALAAAAEASPVSAPDRDCVTVSTEKYPLRIGRASHPGEQHWLWPLQMACHSRIWPRLMYAWNSLDSCHVLKGNCEDLYLAWTGMQACRPAAVSGPRPGCPGERPRCARQWCPHSTDAPRGSPPTLASPPAACLHMHLASLSVLPILSNHVIVHARTRMKSFPEPGWSTQLHVACEMSACLASAMHLQNAYARHFLCH